MTSRLKIKLEISYQVVNDESNVKVIKNMNIAEVWWLRLRSVVVRIKCILRVVRLEGVFGAALRMDIQSQQNVESFWVQGESRSCRQDGTSRQDSELVGLE